MTYKVLLADDERIIVEGISSVINWSSLGTELVATARNGVDAYEKIASYKPDIVISDIKMPGMDGITLAQKVYEEFPSTSFILLSGFGEFEYARKAMKFGVKNYLLKPCNEEKISAALQDIIKELEANKQQKEKFLLLEENLEKIQPYMKAQLLAELFTGKEAKSDFTRYEHLFDIKDRQQEVMLAIFEVEGEDSNEHLTYLSEIATELVPAPVLLTVIGKQAIMVVESKTSRDELIQQVTDMLCQFSSKYSMVTTAALSGPGALQEVKKLYQKAVDYLGHKFYLGTGKLITSADIIPAKKQAYSEPFSMDEQEICLMIKSGHKEEALSVLDSLFDSMARQRLGTHRTKSHCIQLYKAIIQAADKDRQLDLHTGTTELLAMETVQQIKAYLVDCAIQLSEVNSARLRTKQSSVTSKVIEIIETHFSNPDLSLKMVANEMLFMNPDYLGKIFKQETGERFSAYLTKWRIEKARAYIAENGDVKMVTLADMVGFGDNPQYFSQVFKKYTGYTPSDYRKAHNLF